MRTAVIIPARLASTRLPRKALADIHGKPAIQWVYERSKAAKLVEEVFVATPDEELKDVVEGFGGRVILTGPAPTVLDRCSMAAEELPEFEHLVVVQGDEPTIRPEMIDMVSECRSNIACLVKKVTRKEAEDQNTVKAVIDSAGFFIYLSRSVIPGGSPEGDYNATPEYYKQVCVMGFHPSMLKVFKNFPMGPLEKSEGIDLLRYLEQGRFILSRETGYDTQALDTQADLEKIRRILA